MTAQIKELKTVRNQSREGMLQYLEDLQAQVKEDKVQSLIIIFSDDDENIKTQAIGDAAFTTIIGMIDTAKLAFQLGHFSGEDD